MTTTLSYAGHTRATLTLGLPLVGSFLAQFAISVTDAMMLGWYDIGVLAAQALAGMIFLALFVTGSGFANAVMPLVASAAGSGEERQVRRVTRMGLWMSVGFGLLVMPVFVFSRPILLILGQTPEVAELARQYLVISGWAILPALLVRVLTSYLSALEMTRIVLLVTLVAVAVNALVNYALIFGNWGAPELGIRGAAIASVSVHVASMLALIVYAIRATPQHALFQRIWRPDREAFDAVFRLGWPIGAASLSEVSLFAGSTIMMGWLGTVTLAAHGIALQIVSLVFMVHLGLSSAGTVRAGRALGRGDPVGLRRGAVAVTLLSLAVAALTMIVFLTMPASLIGLFIAPDDPERPVVIATGVKLLAAAALFQLVDAAQVTTLSLLRGVQDTKVPMIMAVISYWLVGVPASLVLGFWLGWGGVGIWLGLACGLALAAVTLMTRFWLFDVRQQ